MSIDWHRFDLQQIELACLHERAESLIEHIRAVRFAPQSCEPFGHNTGVQASEPANSHTVDVVNRSWRDRDFHRHPIVHCLLRRDDGYHFTALIPARFELRLASPRNVLDLVLSTRY